MTAAAADKPIEWPHPLRLRISKLIARMADDSEAEVLNAARSLVSTLQAAQHDVHDLAQFALEAEPPEPAGGPLARIVRRMLQDIAAKAWAMKADEVAAFNTLSAKFTEGGRLGSEDLAELDKLLGIARRRA